MIIKCKVDILSMVGSRGKLMEFQNRAHPLAVVFCLVFVQLDVGVR